MKLHLLEKSTVTYNNQINQAESVNNLMQQVSNVLTTSIQTLDQIGSLIDPKPFLSYVQNLIRDIDPNTETFITEETLEKYSKLTELKYNASLANMGIDPTELE